MIPDTSGPRIGQAVVGEHLDDFPHDGQAKLPRLEFGAAVAGNDTVVEQCSGPDVSNNGDTPSCAFAKAICVCSGTGLGAEYFEALVVEPLWPVRDPSIY